MKGYICANGLAIQFARVAMVYRSTGNRLVVSISGMDETNIPKEDEAAFDTAFRVFLEIKPRTIVGNARNGDKPLTGSELLAKAWALHRELDSQPLMSVMMVEELENFNAMLERYIGSSERADSDLSEALNSGDGVYRP